MFLRQNTETFSPKMRTATLFLSCLNLLNHLTHEILQIVHELYEKRQKL